MMAAEMKRKVGSSYNLASDGKTVVRSSNRLKKPKIIPKRKTTIDDLPNEIMIDILSWLNLNERKVTRLVCKGWKDLNYRKCLINEDTVAISNYNAINNCAPDLPPCVVNLRILVPSCAEIRLKSGRKFWGNYGLQVEKVILIFERVCLNYLQHILKNCKNLRCLIIEDIGIEMCKCSDIRRLDCSTLDTVVFFSLNGIILKNFPYALFGSVGNMKSVDIISNIKLSAIDIKCLREIIQYFATNTEILTIELYRACDDVINIISDFENKLTGLARVSLGGTPSKLMNFLASECPNVQKIAFEIMKDSPYAEGELNSFCKSLTLLTHVAVKCLNSHVSLAALGQLPNLAFLDVEANASAVKNLFCRAQPKIVFLKLVLCALYSGEISVLSPNLPNLQHLEIVGPGITFGAVLSSIAEYNQQLQCLILKNVDRAVSGIEFRPYLRCLTELVHLEVTDDPGIEMYALDAFFEECVYLKKLRTLVTDFNPDTIFHEYYPQFFSLFRNQNFQHLSGDRPIPCDTRPFGVRAKRQLAICRPRAGSGVQCGSWEVIEQYICMWHDGWSIIPTITYH